jgi:uncharacterized protein involved in exopolysaccharide biosynthesis
MTRLNSALAEAETVLGPNNPKLIALRNEQRIVQQAAAQAATPASQVAQQRLAAEQATSARLEQQKQKVLAERLTMLQLRLQQDLIEAYTSQINSLTNGINAMRVGAAADTTTIVPIGAAKSNPRPSFPNPSLIMFGTGGLGLVLGSLLALLCEMFARHVRNPQTLEAAVGAPLLGVVPRWKPDGGKVTLRRGPALVRALRKRAA